MTILATILGISLLIVLHELGHFAVARLCGMRVERFSVGFGPTLLARKFGTTTWQVAAVPLGGFVEIAGMDPEEGDVAGGFRSRPLWQRALVMLAGPAANWCTAALILGLLAATAGVMHYDESRPMLGEVTPTGPAAQAGLQPGDLVTRIDGQPIENWQGIVEMVRAHPGRRLTFHVERQGAAQEIAVTPRASGGNVGIIEAMPFGERQTYTPGMAMWGGAQSAWRLTAQHARLLGGLLTGRAKGQLAGLPGIVKAVSGEAQRGLARLGKALAWLSIGLCLLNLLPVPSLDGSRLLFLGIEAVRRRPVDAHLEGTVHRWGFMLLLATMVYVSINDLM